MSHNSFTPPTRVVFLALIAVTLIGNTATGQSLSRVRSSIGFSGGVTQWDMSGTGTAPFAALRLDHELTSWLVADGALGLFSPDEQTTSRCTYLVPEAQLQVQLPFATVRPYLGVGIGTLEAIRGSSRRHGVGSVSVGTRVSVTDALDARAELRVNAQSATLAQWTFGLARRF